MSNVDKLDREMLVTKPQGDMLYYDIQQWHVEGKGFTETDTYFDRLPARARGIVRDPVWELSQHAAGMCCYFETDATTITARYRLRFEALAMDHMPATGMSGLDLYTRRPDGTWAYVGVGRPVTYPDVEVVLNDSLPPGRREYLLYLPLYNGVESLEIGVPKDAAFAGIPPRTGKPIVMYGTSILQGACASRPGMCHTALLQRRLDRPVINLGFSGNAQMEPEIADLLAELDPLFYVIDALPNMTQELIDRNTETFLRKLIAARPNTPLVLIEDRTYTNAPYHTANHKRNQTSRAAFRKVYEKLRAEDGPQMVYVPGDSLLGADGLDAVDGSHPTDLGFMRIADTLEPVLRPLLK